jgi:uncharacterized protein YgbK (DUF1537 family)
LIEIIKEDSEPQSSVSLAITDGIVLLADDLTGACDSAVAFVASGRPVRVILNSPSFDSTYLLDEAGAGAVLAFTMESRSLSLEQACSRVNDSIAILQPGLHNRILFQKVDSAGRGHFGAEIAAALRASSAAFALVAPAFPEIGRTVQGGILHIGDWSGQNSSLRLRDLFPVEYAPSIDLLPVCSESVLLHSAQRSSAKGKRILLCDATTQEDIERLAAAALLFEERVLWAGSAGLAHALAANLPQLSSSSIAPTSVPSGEVLLFSGTPHSITSLQLSHLEESAVPRTRRIHRVDWSITPKKQVLEAFNAQPTAALILTGGETAAFVLRSLDASSIRLAGEMARGVPWGFIEGGMADGCIVITKSGGFGQRDALAHAFDFCERRTHGVA